MFPVYPSVWDFKKKKNSKSILAKTIKFRNFVSICGPNTKNYKLHFKNFPNVLKNYNINLISKSQFEDRNYLRNFVNNFKKTKFLQTFTRINKI